MAPGFESPSRATRQPTPLPPGALPAHMTGEPPPPPSAPPSVLANNAATQHSGDKQKLLPPRPPASAPPSALALTQGGSTSATAGPSREGGMVVSEQDRNKLLPVPPSVAARQQQEERDVFLIPGLQDRVFSAEEVKNAFDSIDVDKNGHLDESDVRQMLALAGETATDEEVREMIRMVDHDGSNIVSFDEFAEMCLNPTPLFKNCDLASAAMGNLGARAADDAARRFLEQMHEEEEEKKARAAQGGAAGGLSRAGRLEVMKEFTAGKAMRPAQLKRIFHKFQEVDADGSGLIGYDEFLAVLEKPDTPMLRRMFQIFDVDGSGEIELKEFVVGLSRYTSSNPADKLRFAFLMFDEDGSGFLEKEEIIKILRANAPGQVSETWLNKRAELLYEEIGLPKGTRISLEQFAEVAERNPAMLMPAFEQLRDIDSNLDTSPTHARAGGRGGAGERLAAPTTGFLAAAHSH